MTYQTSLRQLLSRSRPFLFITLLATAVFFLTGCEQTGTMIDQPYYRPLAQSDLFPDGRSARPFLPGTVPYLAGDESPDDPARTGLDEEGQPVEGFPIEVNQELLALGQEEFTIYCTPCHGPAGEGNGKATAFGFPKPPSLLQSDLSDGEIFQIITEGQGTMFPYGYRVKPNERWAVIAYIRALQLRGEAVNAQDLSPEEINQIGNQP